MRFCKKLSIAYLFPPLQSPSISLQGNSQLPFVAQDACANRMGGFPFLKSEKVSAGNARRPVKPAKT